MRLIEKFSSLFAIVTILAVSMWTVGCGGDTGAPAGGGGAPVTSDSDDHSHETDDGHSHDDELGSSTGGGVELPGDDAADEGPADAPETPDDA